MKEHNNRKKAKYFTNILIHTVFALNIVAMNTMVFQDYKKAIYKKVEINHKEEREDD